LIEVKMAISIGKVSRTKIPRLPELQKNKRLYLLIKQNWSMCVKGKISGYDLAGRYAGMSKFDKGDTIEREWALLIRRARGI